jgi:hypothetical protein
VQICVPVAAIDWKLEGMLDGAAKAGHGELAAPGDP